LCPDRAFAHNERIAAYGDQWRKALGAQGRKTQLPGNWEAYQTKTIPIVFVSVTDPVASGFVASLSHPVGDITGFSNFTPTLAGKHIEILKELVPGATAVADMFNPDNNPAHLSSFYPVL
jgi:putative ABC transport system substrate-binding protein